MYIDVDLQSRLQPFVLFDWRLLAERGLRCYGHFHRASDESQTVASCETGFLLRKLPHGRDPLPEEAAWPAGSASSATRRAAQFKCVGAIRKAGFLSAKKWILKRRSSIELARKQGWKRYWVCLRGTALLFHSLVDTSKQAPDERAATSSSEAYVDLRSWIQANCAGQLQVIGRAYCEQHQHQQQASPEPAADYSRQLAQCYIEKEPRHLIIVDGAIAQPIPEHPKRDHVFCLSTSFGDAYLFQASCQRESDNWIAGIHNACAASIARDLTRDEAIKLFECKVRRLEEEAEKKLFLRQRLDSRLTSMSTISHISTLGLAAHASQAPLDEGPADGKRATMRQLLLRLNQQMLALDSYIEQVHCEVYQLRCYLASCGAQRMFYQASGSSLAGAARPADLSPSPVFMATDLPHPKSLLMHVSKPTKLLLIKLGIFTVSSFHAYIHARQGSAESILHKIQQAAGQQSPLQLRIMSTSIYEAAFLSQPKKAQLESDSERLIQMTDLKSVRVRLAKDLYEQILATRGRSSAADEALLEGDPAARRATPSSDDSHTLEDRGQFVFVTLKLHSSSSGAAIIKQVLKILARPEPAQADAGQLDFLNYYLSLAAAQVHDARAPASSEAAEPEYLVKRRETLADWPAFEHLDMREKLVFRVELARSRIDEEASPFGISIGAQLFMCNFESTLNVYCSYIEWGSAADKAGLKDDDELLTINGVPVKDLDMMFVECIIQDENKLRLVVRSNRSQVESRARPVKTSLWQPYKDDDDDDDDDHHDRDGDEDRSHDGRGRKDLGPYSSLLGSSRLPGEGASTQVISDEYITSLVCPPPPTRSSAFLRTDPSLLRQKSDLTDKQRAATQGASARPEEPVLMTKAKSQHRLDASRQAGAGLPFPADRPASQSTFRPAEPCQQAARKTEQLTKLLSGPSKQSAAAQVGQRKSSGEETLCTSGSERNALSATPPADPNSVERLRKAICELLETEYAYVRHLETINEHYMSPLGEVDFLNIADLRRLHKIVFELLRFQHAFFAKLLQAIWRTYRDETRRDLQPGASQATDYSLTITSSSHDEFAELSKILKYVDGFRSIEHFQTTIHAIAGVFASEADHFKQYASYCATYSRLQRLLHPKSTHNALSGSPPITAMPSSLDTFSFSSSGQISVGCARADFLKPFGAFMTLNTSVGLGSGGEPGAPSQLKRLSEFLSNLDSSSSSVSVSFPKSANTTTASADGPPMGEQAPSQQQPQSQRHAPSAGQSVAAGGKAAGGCSQASSQHSAHAGAHQKSVHQQNFESYLIKPIQRIVKYPMLLNSIALSCSAAANGQQDAAARAPASLTPASDIQAAVKLMESTTNSVNDAQRIHDEYGSVFQIIERRYLAEQQALASQTASLAAHSAGGSKGPAPSSAPTPSPGCPPHQPAISLDTENLLYFGPVEWLNINEFTSKLKKGAASAPALSQMLFVFNSCVVFICKEQVRPSQPAAEKTKKTAEKSAGGALSFHSASSQHASSMAQSGSHATTSKGAQASAHKLPPATECTEVIRYQSLIPVSEVQVRSVPTGGAPAAPDNQFRWELFRCSSVNSNSSLLTKSSKRNSGKVYVLASPSGETRNAFLRRIRHIIRESVRNMSLPLARSPSSKSATPKKLSSPSSNTNSSCSQSTSPVSNRVDDQPGARSQLIDDGANTQQKSTIADCKFSDQVAGSAGSAYNAARIQVNNLC